MIARLEEKAYADATHKATSNVYTVVHRTDGLKTIAKRVQDVSQLFASERHPSTQWCSSADLVKAFEVKHSNFDETYYPEDVYSLQPTSGASGEYADPLVIRKYQESIDRNVCIIPKSAHGVNPDSAVMSHIDMKIKWIDESQGVPLEKFMSAQHRNHAEDVKENKLKGLVIVHCYQFDNEMIAVKSYKGPDYSRWNDWQSIVIETEYDDAWMDKADENSQCLETYNAMRKTTESEREAKDQITEQINKYARNGGRQYCQVFIWLSKIDLSTGPKVETEMLSVKMHLAKAISWNQVKSGDDVAEKFVSNDAKKTFTEATQLLKSV